MVASSAWGGSTHDDHNYTSILWSRIFQGVALAPFEALVNACVGDLYFVHERGVRMAITNTCLFGGAFLTPVFVGMIAADIGWQWSVSDWGWECHRLVNADYQLAVLSTRDLHGPWIFAHPVLRTGDGLQKSASTGPGSSDE
jgi:MFS family permease